MGIEAFLLGLSTGIYCFAQCGIVLFPYIISSETSSFKQNFLQIFKYILGRLIAYILVGAVAGSLGFALNGQLHFSNQFWTQILLGVSYLILAVLMIFHSLSFYQNNHLICRISKAAKKYNAFPLLLGIFTGINLCPPFLIAIGKVFNQAEIIGGILYFVIFFLATTLFFIPLVFTTKIRQKESVRMVGRIASFLAGIFLIFQCIFTFLK